MSVKTERNDCDDDDEEREPEQQGEGNSGSVIDKVRKWSIRFDGHTDPLAFLERVEELAQSYGLDTNNIPAIMPELLQKDALMWWRANNEGWRKWTLFRQAFLQFFQPSQYFNDLEDKLRVRSDLFQQEMFQSQETPNRHHTATSDRINAATACLENSNCGADEQRPSNQSTVAVRDSASRQLRLLNNRIFATVGLGRKMTQAVIDTGSTESFISRALANTLKQDDSIISTDGSDHHVTDDAQSLKIPVTFAGRQKYIRFLILPDVKDEIILGIDFLKLNETSIICNGEILNISEATKTTEHKTESKKTTMSHMSTRILAEDVLSTRSNSPDHWHSELEPISDEELPSSTTTTTTSPKQKQSQQTTTCAKVLPSYNVQGCALPKKSPPLRWKLCECSYFSALLAAEIMHKAAKWTFGSRLGTLVGKFPEKYNLRIGREGGVSLKLHR